MRRGGQTERGAFTQTAPRELERLLEQARRLGEHDRTRGERLRAAGRRPKARATRAPGGGDAIRTTSSRSSGPKIRPITFATARALPPVASAASGFGRLDSVRARADDCAGRFQLAAAGGSLCRKSRSGAATRS